MFFMEEVRIASSSPLWDPAIGSIVRRYRGHPHVAVLPGITISPFCLYLFDTQQETWSTVPIHNRLPLSASLVTLNNVLHYLGGFHLDHSVNHLFYHTYDPRRQVWRSHQCDEYDYWNHWVNTPHGRIHMVPQFFSLDRQTLQGVLLDRKFHSCIPRGHQILASFFPDPLFPALVGGEHELYHTKNLFCKKKWPSWTKTRRGTYCYERDLYGGTVIADATAYDPSTCSFFRMGGSVVGARRASAACYRLDRRVKTPIPLSPMLTGRFNHSAVVVEDHSIYVTGGEYYTFAMCQDTNLAERYDIRQDRWMAIPPMPYSMTEHTSEWLYI